MQQSDTNMPYKSFYKYPVSESVQQSYNEELTFNRTMGTTVPMRQWTLRPTRVPR